MRTMDRGGVDSRGRGTDAPQLSKGDNYFELSSRSPEHFAALLKTRHGLSELAALYAVFRSDPGREVHPDRLCVSSDGFSFSDTREPSPPVSQGWLVIERYWDGGGPDVYMRIRSFETYRGAVAEFSTKLELCSIGSLEVANRATSPGEAEAHFHGVNRAYSLVCAGR
jgi:hypothetical protein